MELQSTDTKSRGFKVEREAFIYTISSDIIVDCTVGFRLAEEILYKNPMLGLKSESSIYNAQQFQFENPEEYG